MRLRSPGGGRPARGPDSFARRSSAHVPYGSSSRTSPRRDESARSSAARAARVGAPPEGLNEQCVEAVEVDHHQLRGESVRLSLCHHELSPAADGGREVAAEHGHEGMERPGDVVRRISAPEQVRHAIEGDRVAARREQDLEHLLRPGSAEVAGAEHVVSALHRQRPEQANHRAFGGHCTARANARMYG